jgi:CheY-like chemotaxis protein
MLRQSILLVDDEEVLIRALRGLLRDERYQILSTNSGKEALELVSKNSFAAVIADQRMPGMSGTDLLEEVRLISEDSVRVILSGFSDLNMMMDVLYQGRIYLYLKKPWDEEHLLGALRQSVLRYEIIRSARISNPPQNYAEICESRNAGLLVPLETCDSKAVEILSEILAQVPVASLITNVEGEVLFLNSAARIIFTTYTELKKSLNIREILEPNLLNSFESFLSSEETEILSETTGGTVAFSKIGEPTEPQAFCLRYYIDENRLGVDSES